MNANAILKSYGILTPEERFRLILCASGRGDEEERSRLGRAGDRITLSIQDHAPYAHAFNEAAILTYIELLEEAARYRDAIAWLFEALDLFSDEEDESREATKGEGEFGAESTRHESVERTVWQVVAELVRAAAFMLWVKAAGWQLFCERMEVPAFLIWKVLPGFDRLQRSLALAEKDAFDPDGLRRWLNAVRPEDEPEVTEVPLTAERMVDGNEEMYRQRVQWWGG